MRNGFWALHGVSRQRGSKAKLFPYSPVRSLGLTSRWVGQFPEIFTMSIRIVTVDPSEIPVVEEQPQNYIGITLDITRCSKVPPYSRVHIYDEESLAPDKCFERKDDVVLWGEQH